MILDSYEKRLFVFKMYQTQWRLRYGVKRGDGEGIIQELRWISSDGKLVGQLVNITSRDLNSPAMESQFWTHSSRLAHSIATDWSRWKLLTRPGRLRQGLLCGPGQRLSGQQSRLKELLHASNGDVIRNT